MPITDIELNLIGGTVRFVDEAGNTAVAKLLASDCDCYTLNHDGQALIILERVWNHPSRRVSDLLPDRRQDAPCAPGPALVG